ncbi:sensor histidine kinase [Cohnella caldifontis]|uniref:sensor histidine kinase n=1 Tax=Cohnella caldifontis TaxID=3027471 RepID=UPI0023ED8499|nr:histidine kinase [Cohnella sp. YIM B05605]
MNLITKLMLLIVALMAPVIVLFLYSNQQSSSVVEEQINLANQERLSRFLGSIEETMDQVSVYANIVTKDPDFAELVVGAVPSDGYDYSMLIETIERKLNLFSSSTSWMNRISVYFPAAKLALSSHGKIPYEDVLPQAELHANWSLQNVTVSGILKRAFTRYFVTPSLGTTDPEKISMIVRVDLMEDNIVNLLNRFKTSGNNDPFFYRSSREYLLNDSADGAVIRELIGKVEFGADSGTMKHEAVELRGKRYLVYDQKSDNLGWTLVDYVPLEDILAPVTRSKHLFGIFAALVLLAGTVYAFLLYVQVQRPIERITAGVAQVKKGRFSARISGKMGREFEQLGAQFNEMAAQLQHLVEKAYLEEIRAKEAVMKQLQSQINPHFLYNSLAFIVSMAKLNRPASIIAMAHGLADYYRYTTRNDQMVTTLREELRFVGSYVEIMNYQLDKIRFTTDIPERLLEQPTPRLLIQPLVENAIVHGLEPKPGRGEIRIVGSEETGKCRLTVEDDGLGLSDAELARLRARLSGGQAAAAADGGERRYGLRNVYERHRYFYGGGSEMLLDRSPSGGMRVTLTWEQPGTPSLPAEEAEKVPGEEEHKERGGG